MEVFLKMPDYKSAYITSYVGRLTFLKSKTFWMKEAVNQFTSGAPVSYLCTGNKEFMSW